MGSIFTSLSKNFDTLITNVQTTAPLGVTSTPPDSTAATTSVHPTLMGSVTSFLALVEQLRLDMEKLLDPSLPETEVERIITYYKLDERGFAEDVLDGVPWYLESMDYESVLTATVDIEPDFYSTRDGPKKSVNIWEALQGAVDYISGATTGVAVDLSDPVAIFFYLSLATRPSASGEIVFSLSDIKTLATGFRAIGVPMTDWTRAKEGDRFSSLRAVERSFTHSVQSEFWTEYRDARVRISKTIQNYGNLAQDLARGIEYIGDIW
ncbi:hypothetical protein ABW19_dt0206571 [Dactylella cylindrospora]|nr:hypothetical protein ABW19_dt0206571 [Dactylella cylindrospora]